MDPYGIITGPYVVPLTQKFNTAGAFGMNLNAVVAPITEQGEAKVKVRSRPGIRSVADTPSPGPYVVIDPRDFGVR